MKRQLVVLDVDSTLINQEVIELIADKAGALELVSTITERAMRGELDFSQSLIERVSTLRGLPESVFNDIKQQITLTKGAESLISSVKASGGYVGVVSGGFHEILDPLATSLGLDFWKANSLEVKDGILTGKVQGDIIDAQAKADALIEWSKQLDIPLENTAAIGDGANDLLMMEAAGFGIAFCAKPVVQEKADVAINERDLSLVLGYLGL